MARLLGLPDERADGLFARLYEDVNLLPEMTRAVEALHERAFRTGVLSNSWWMPVYDDPFYDRAFDVQVISGQVGVRKPSREMFELGAERLGIPPERIVFVDDFEENLVPARAMGMAGVLHARRPGPDHRRARAAVRRRRRGHLTRPVPGRPRGSGEPLDDHRHAHAAGDAHRLDPVGLVERLEVVEQRGHDRAPVIPKGWPSAIAPPNGLSWSSSSPSSSLQGTICAANASLISTMSMSAIVMSGLASTSGSPGSARGP
jgi:HAD superfamily hydrolase (TIGR01509 family)